MARDRSSRSRGADLPWLTLALAAVFVLTSLQAVRVSGPLVEAAEAALSEAEERFEAFPYLEPGAALRAHLGAERIARARRESERAREAGETPPVFPGLMRRQQQALDAHVAEASEALASLPARRLGVSAEQWRPATLLTHVAVHGGALLLAGNLVLLLVLGVYLEPALGPTRSLLVCLCATLGSGLAYAFSQAGAGHVLTGACGLLAGLLVVFAWEMRESRAEGFYGAALLGGSAWLVAPPLLGASWPLSHPGVELLGAAPSPRAVLPALAGGAAGALSIHAVLNLLGGRRDRVSDRHSARTSTGSVGVDDALKSRAAGREEAAYQQLTVVLRKDPEQLDAALLLSDVARSLGRHDAADSAMLRAIRIEAKRDETAAAVRHWLDLTHRGIPRSADAALLIRIATLLRHHDHPRAASQALRAALERASGSNTAVVASRVARAAQELDPSIAHDAAWKALGCPELTLEERQNIEDLLGTVIMKMPGTEVMLARAGERERPAPIEVETRTRVLDAVQAVPVELDEAGLRIATKKGDKKRILFERIEAVAVAAVEGISERPVLVIDVVLNWKDSRDDRLRVIRLRGDRFDPRRVYPAKSPVDSVRGVVRSLLEKTQATPLPDQESALGTPFASFETLQLYERTVLMAEAPLTLDDD